MKTKILKKSLMLVIILLIVLIPVFSFGVEVSSPEYWNDLANSPNNVEIVNVGNKIIGIIKMLLFILIGFLM